MGSDTSEALLLVLLRRLLGLATLLLAALAGLLSLLTRRRSLPALLLTALAALLVLLALLLLILIVLVLIAIGHGEDLSVARVRCRPTVPARGRSAFAESFFFDLPDNPLTFGDATRMRDVRNGISVNQTPT